MQNQPVAEPYRERNWFMLRWHIRIGASCALLFLPLVFLDHWKVALALPAVALGLFELYCRVQRDRAIYHTQGSLTTVREASEWSAEKFLDYFSPWDQRRFAQWWIQQFTHGFKAMGAHKGRANRDAPGSIRVRTRNLPKRHEAEILASMRELHIGSQPDGPSAEGQAFRQSGMAIRSITNQASEAMARGAAGLCWIGTGEGGLWGEHLAGGERAQVEFQVGTGYFGCRNPDGTFNLEKLVALVRAHAQIVAVEIKLSQGAKQDGGKAPGWKMEEDVAEHRGVEPWKDCFTPPTHSAFENAEGLARFVHMVRQATGKVVGVKMAIGSFAEFDDMCRAWAAFPEGMPDYVQIDGGEGGTGASYEEVMKCAGMDTSTALQVADILLTKHGLRKRVRIVGSGGGFYPEDIIRMYALGADIVATARGFKYMVGCIGASKCHIGRNPTPLARLVARLRGTVAKPRGECPTGVAGNGEVINPVQRGRWVRAAVTAEFERTAHLLSFTGISDYHSVVGSRLKYIDILGVRIWTPSEVEGVIAAERAP